MAEARLFHPVNAFPLWPDSFQVRAEVPCSSLLERQLKTFGAVYEHKNFPQSY